GGTEKELKMIPRRGTVGVKSCLSSVIIGELACGNLKNRAEILSLLKELPMTLHAEHEEVMGFIDNYRLMGKGLGYMDMHLLASAILTKIPFWTLDKRLQEVSLKLGLKY
ncbi:MAG: hypothetical protein AAB251_06125, partial [Deltaproteobacteria bacterium]